MADTLRHVCEKDFDLASDALRSKLLKKRKPKCSHKMVPHVGTWQSRNKPDEPWTVGFFVILTCKKCGHQPDYAVDYRCDGVQDFEAFTASVGSAMDAQVQQELQEFPR